MRERAWRLPWVTLVREGALILDEFLGGVAAS